MIKKKSNFAFNVREQFFYLPGRNETFTAGLDKHSAYNGP